MSTVSSEESLSTRSEVGMEIILEPLDQDQGRQTIESSSTHLTNTANQSQLEHMMQQQMILTSALLGSSQSSNSLHSFALESQKSTEINSAKTLPNLQSHAKPHEILEKPPEQKVLRVNKEDILALCQMLTEFREQFD